MAVDDAVDDEAIFAVCSTSMVSAFVFAFAMLYRSVSSLKRKSTASVGNS